MKNKNLGYYRKYPNADGTWRVVGGHRKRTPMTFDCTYFHALESCTEEEADKYMEENN